MAAVAGAVQQPLPSTWRIKAAFRYLPLKVRTWLVAGPSWFLLPRPALGASPARYHLAMGNHLAVVLLVCWEDLQRPINVATQAMSLRSHAQLGACRPSPRSSGLRREPAAQARFHLQRTRAPLAETGAGRRPCAAHVNAPALLIRLPLLVDAILPCCAALHLSQKLSAIWS